MRWWAVATLGALLLALGIVLAFRVPWSAASAPRTDQLAALRDLPPDTVARGKAFHAATRPAAYGALVVGLVTALVLGLSPAGARLVELTGRPFGDHWLARAVLGGLAVVFVVELVTLPFSAWRHRVLRAYGLSTQDWSAWAADLLKAYAVGAVIGALALVGFFSITRWLPTWWWAVGAVGAAGLMVLLTFVFPVLVEPVFNKFTPMPSGALRTELVQLAARDGVPVRDVLVADASRRTRAVNAYVSGFGPTRRVVVYDTLLREATEAEVLAVVAHELGHAKDRDVVTGTLIGALGTAAGVCGLYLLGFWAAPLHRAGVTSISEPRAVALLVAVAAVVGFLGTPAQAYLSRHIEARADAHALALTGDPATFEAMMARLALVNLADVDPSPVEYAIFSSHPSPVQRMAMARAWARR
jgi:Zn-dependent protease with chaperone function